MNVGFEALKLPYNPKGMVVVSRSTKAGSIYYQRSGDGSRLPLQVHPGYSPLVHGHHHTHFLSNFLAISSLVPYNVHFTRMGIFIRQKFLAYTFVVQVL